MILRRSERLTARGTPPRLMRESLLDALDAEDVPANRWTRSRALSRHTAHLISPRVTGGGRGGGVLYGGAIRHVVLLLVEEENSVRSMGSLVALRFTPVDSPGSSSTSRSSTTSAATHRTDGERSRPLSLAGCRVLVLGPVSGRGVAPRAASLRLELRLAPGSSDSSIPVMLDTVMRCRTP